LAESFIRSPFKKAVAVAASDLAPFFGKALKGLWLIDSTMLITLAILFGLIAAGPVMASLALAALLALMAGDYGSFALLLHRRDHACASASGRSGFGVHFGTATHQRDAANGYPLYDHF
jgi:hypothetical protein